MAKKSTPKKAAPKAAKTTKASKVVKASKASAQKAPSKTSKVSFKQLNTWNLVMAGLHFVQGVAVIVLSKAASLPVTTNYLTLDTLASKTNQPVLVAASRHLFDVNIAYLVAAFFFLSAAAHLMLATVYRTTYEADLKRGINKARWFEYGLSASIMMVAIAMLTGVYDLSSLLMIFALIAIMNMMGLLMEIHNQTTNKTNWLSYLVGCKAAIIPWLVVVIYVLGTNNYGSGRIPTFVYWIYASMFILFSSFAVNMYLQYKKIGKWADYMYGEKVYMILSLVAKSLLAWQVFFGALRP